MVVDSRMMDWDAGMLRWAGRGGRVAQRVLERESQRSVHRLAKRPPIGGAAPHALLFCVPMHSYAALTFLSALLLFMVQPLMARAVLPWFGGAASVWTTSLLFYQTLLFGGYAYAHLGRRLGVRRQALLHVSLLGLSLMLLPVTPDAVWKTTGPESPTWRLLGLLISSVGSRFSTGLMTIPSSLKTTSSVAEFPGSTFRRSKRDSEAACRRGRWHAIR